MPVTQCDGDDQTMGRKPQFIDCLLQTKHIISNLSIAINQNYKNGYTAFSTQI